MKLPDLEEDLSADLYLLGLDIRQNALRRREYRVAEAAPISADVRGLLIYPARRLGDAIDAVNARPAAWDEHDADLEGAADDFLALLLDALDVARFLERVGDVLDELGIRDGNDRLLGVGAVLEADDEIRDRIGDHSI